MLADPAFVAAVAVGQDDRLAILRQRLTQVSLRIVDRLHEDSELHVASSLALRRPSLAGAGAKSARLAGDGAFMQASPTREGRT
jgi:hypothetical protein